MCIRLSAPVGHRVKTGFPWLCVPPRGWYLGATDGPHSVTRPSVLSPTKILQKRLLRSLRRPSASYAFSPSSIGMGPGPGCGIQLRARALPDPPHCPSDCSATCVWGALHGPLPWMSSNTALLSSSDTSRTPVTVICRTISEAVVQVGRGKEAPNPTPMLPTRNSYWYTTHLSCSTRNRQHY